MEEQDREDMTGRASEGGDTAGEAGGGVSSGAGAGAGDWNPRSQSGEGGEVY